MPFFFINCMLFLLRFMKIKKININSYFKFHEKTIQQAVYKLRHPLPIYYTKEPSIS